MCGRYVIARAAGDLLAEVDAVPGPELEGLDLGEVRANWNTAPTAQVPIVLERVDDDGQVLRELHLARWGLLPVWARDESFSSRTFNARSETVLEKPSFRAAVKARRCAVPANGYYEWRRRLGPDGEPVRGTRDRPAKQPHWIRPVREQDSIWFAGLYEWWQAPDGAWVLSCTILTRSSPQADSRDPVLSELAAIHDRLPVALRPQDLGDWLDPSADTREQAGHLVERVVAGGLEVAAGWRIDPVGQAVGSVKANDPSLIEPVAALF